MILRINHFFRTIVFDFRQNNKILQILRGGVWPIYYNVLHRGWGSQKGPKKYYVIFAQPLSLCIELCYVSPNLTPAHGASSARVTRTEQTKIGLTWNALLKYAWAQEENTLTVQITLCRRVGCHSTAGTILVEKIPNRPYQMELSKFGSVWTIAMASQSFYHFRWLV